jgi:TonB-dependent receptor
MKNISFKKKLIASTIGTYAMVGLSGMAMAQDNQMVAEEVVVTGIRGSLMRSMDIKRDSHGVVDAISAEDIGKFPDTNLAESLQRITGVSIDRRDGEGSKVTVRGLGPDFNLVTLNGRQLPGATIEATFASGSRSFDFANIASEGVKAIEVYKTARADVPPGGMGATINIVTPKPLHDKPTTSIGVKGVWDESSEKDGITPEFSGIYSNSFADGKFGVAIIGSYQEREGGSQSASTGAGWRSFPGTVVQNWGGQELVDFEWGGIDFANGDHRNQPEANDVYSTPQQVVYAFSEFERTRLNGQLTLQFAPTDTIETTLDYTYSKNEFEHNTSDFSAWFNFGGQSTIFTDHESPTVQTPLLYSEDMTNGDLAMGVGMGAQVYENDSLGFNVKWEPTDQLKLALDYHSSTAEAKPDSIFGNSVGIAVSAYVRDRTTGNFEGEMPVVLLDILDGAGGTALRTEDLQVSGSFFRASQMKHEIDQLQLDGEWEFNNNLSLSFGLARTESDYRSAFSNVQRDTWGGLGAAGELPAEYFTRETILDNFSGSYGQTSAEEMAFLGGISNDPFNERFVFDFNTVRDFAAANYDDGAGPAECANGSTWYCATAPDQFNEIAEDSDSAYVQINFDTELAGMPFAAIAGVRYESTTVETPASAQAYGPIQWLAANELTMPAVGDPAEVIDSGEYDFYLPSLDLKLDVLDDVVLRASYGQSIARPNWLNLRGGTSYDTLVRPQGGTASRGTPGLEPFKSDNIDLSVEWYYGDASYASLGYFKKEIENFIGSRVVTEEGPLDNTPHPNTGSRAQAAIDSGIAPNDSVAIRQYIFDNFPDPETAYLDGSGNIVIVGIPGDDENATFQITETANSDQKVDIDGWELAVQHTFGDSGFGVIANYTIVDESTEFDDMLLRDPQFAITGVSNTANVVGFYEKYGLSARIAYNWRDSFLASGASGTGNNPVYVDEYGQFDLNVGYDVTDELTVFLEGLNILEESGRTYGRADEQTLGYFEGHRRINIGARYSF